MQKFTEHIEQIDESTLSRVWQIASDNTRVFAILTARRNGNTDIENKSRNAKLKNDIRKAGYGFFRVTGYWTEDEGTEDEVAVEEESFFVSIPVGEDEKAFNTFVIKALKKWDQDAAVIKLSDNNVSLIDKSGKTYAQIGKFNVNKVATMYSKLQNGRTFVFESAVTSGSFISKLTERENNKRNSR